MGWAKSEMCVCVCQTRIYAQYNSIWHKFKSHIFNAFINMSPTCVISPVCVCVSRESMCSWQIDHPIPFLVKKKNLIHNEHFNMIRFLLYSNGCASTAKNFLSFVLPQTHLAFFVCHSLRVNTARWLHRLGSLHDYYMGYMSLLLSARIMS